MCDLLDLGVMCDMGGLFHLGGLGYVCDLGGLFSMGGLAENTER